MTSSKNLAHNISQLYQRLATCGDDDEEIDENVMDLSAIFNEKVQHLQASLETFYNTKQQSHPDAGTNEQMEFNLLQGEKLRRKRMSGLREAYSLQSYEEALAFELQEPTASCTRQRSAGADSREGRGP